MTLQQIKQAIDNGHTVHWSNESYTVVKDSNDSYLIKQLNGSCIGLTHRDGVSLNGEESEFFVALPI